MGLQVLSCGHQRGRVFWRTLMAVMVTMVVVVVATMVDSGRVRAGVRAYLDDWLVGVQVGVPPLKCVCGCVMSVCECVCVCVPGKAVACPCGHIAARCPRHRGRPERWRCVCVRSCVLV